MDRSAGFQGCERCMASPYQIISWGGGGGSLALRFVLRTIPEREARTLPLKRGTPITAPVALEMIAAAIAAPVITALVRPFVATLIIETPLQGAQIVQDAGLP